MSSKTFLDVLLDATAEDGGAVSNIKGNAADHVKVFAGRFSQLFTTRERAGFADAVGAGLVVTEVSLNPIAESEVGLGNGERGAAKPKMECRLVCGLNVETNMLNGAGNLHGGCAAYLVDICSTFALMAYVLATKGELLQSVSQSLNIVYHSPAALNDRLRIVNTTMSVGSRAMSARTEIWNATHNRLVASGVHIKMRPSTSKL